MATKTYTNNTNQYQLVANGEKVIATGTEAKCEKALRQIDENNMPYGMVEIVAPGETVIHYTNERPLPEMRNINVEDFFSK